MSNTSAQEKELSKQLKNIEEQLKSIQKEFLHIKRRSKNAVVGAMRRDDDRKINAIRKKLGI